MTVLFVGRNYEGKLTEIAITVLEPSPVMGTDHFRVWHWKYREGQTNIYRRAVRLYDKADDARIDYEQGMILWTQWRQDNAKP